MIAALAGAWVGRMFGAQFSAQVGGYWGVQLCAIAGGLTVALLSVLTLRAIGTGRGSNSPATLRS
jgi:hypothetical protein